MTTPKMIRNTASAAAGAAGAAAVSPAPPLIHTPSAAQPIVNVKNTITPSNHLIGDSFPVEPVAM
jgi:hypothetical protein